MNIAQRRMEKAGADVTGRFDHSGNPRCIAAWSPGLRQTQVSAEVKHESPQFVRRFSYKPSIRIEAVLANQLLDLCLQYFDFVNSQSDPILAIGLPALGTVEGIRREISRQKRNRV